MSSHHTDDSVKKFKDSVAGTELEAHFLQLSGLKSLDELNPTNLSSILTGPTTVMKPVPSGTPVPTKPLPLSTAEATPSPSRMEHLICSGPLLAFTSGMSLGSLLPLTLLPPG